MAAPTRRRPGTHRLAPLLLVVLAACETTGDPTRGGLFGWSKEEADGRQQSLQRQADDARRGAEEARAQVEQSRGEQQSRAAEVATLQGELARLVGENDRLETRLRELMQSRRLKAAQLERLQATLALNEDVRRRARAAAPSKAARTESVDLVGGQNRRIEDDILFLLSNP